jgi:hypothetical protein
MADSETGKKYHTIQGLTRGLEKKRALWFIHSVHRSVTEACAAPAVCPGKPRKLLNPLPKTTRSNF